MNTAYPFPARVFRGLRFSRSLLCLLLACCALSASSSGAQVWMQKLVPAIQVQAATPMLPYLDWLLDPSGRFSVEEVAMPERQASFRPLNMDKLPYESGTVWLRFTLAPRPLESRPSTLLLDLGEGVPSTPTLYVPKRTMTPGVTEWQDFTPSQRAVFLMPDAQSTPVTAYIKMDGLPGIWFDPTLRTPHNAATAMERLARPAVIVALAVVMLLCLLRGLSERGEWRIWTGGFTGAALLHAVWGAPATPYGHVSMADIGAVLAPGVALMLLPHVGRHLMRTRSRARVYDVQYFLLTLPGAVLALLPLIPGFSWTCRFLELWPLGTLLLVPTTVGAWLSGLPGARRFLLGCLAPAVGTGLGILGIGSPVPDALLATAPLWGLALGALIIAGTATTSDQLENEAPPDAETPSAPPAEADLRIITHDDLPEGDMVLPVLGDPSPARPHPAPGAEELERQALALEKRLRAPLDVLLREGAALGECSLPPAARQHAEAMVNAVRSMAVTLADPVGGEAPPAAMENGEQVFDLQQMLREAHDNVAVSAENKNVALSWFMPPYLPQQYEGDGTRLSQVLRMLLESSVRATSRGAVQLAVRRVPESVEPGHLLFTVTDTGDGVPPAERSSLALARAWELAGAHKGFLGVESSPQGASVSFTVHLGVHQGDVGVEPSAASVERSTAQSVIIADDSPSNRQLLAFFLEGLPYLVREARAAEDAAALFMQEPAALLIFDGDMFADQTLSAVSGIRAFEREQGLPPASMLALTEDDSRWEALHEAGFTHALAKPVTRSGLRKTVLELLPPAAEDAGSSVRATPDAETLPPLRMDSPTPAPRDDDEVIIDTGLPLTSVSPETVRVVEPPLQMAAQAGPGAQPQPAALSGPVVPEPPLRMVEPVPTAASSEQPLRVAAPAPSAVPAEAPLQMSPPQRVSPQQDSMEDLLTDLFGPETLPTPSGRPVQTSSAPSAAAEPLRMTPPGQAVEWVGDPMPLSRAASPSPDLAARSAPSSGNFEPLRFGPAEEGVRPAPAAESAQPEPLHPASRGNAQRGSSLVADAGEWVGEPMPVGAPASRPSARSVQAAPSLVPDSPSAAPSGGKGHEEWVGEPIPIPKAAPSVASPASPRNILSAPQPSPAPGAPYAAPRPISEPQEEPPFIPLTLEPPARESVRRVSERQSAFREAPGQSADRRPASPAAQSRPQPVPPPAAAPSGRTVPAAARPSARQGGAVRAASPSTASGNVSELMPVSSSAEASASLAPIADLLVVLDAAMFDARTAFAQGDPQGVQAAAGRIASQADGCGLRVLARMARCVEGAAKARDRDALTYLLPELETAVERNRIALMPKK